MNNEVIQSLGSLSQEDNKFCDSHCTWLSHHPGCKHYFHEPILDFAIMSGLRKEPGADREYIGDFDWRNFARCIIRECCEVIEKHDEPVYDGKILLKHFGVYL